MTVLCTVADYWRITADLSTSAPTVTAAIDDATSLVEDEIMRPLRSQSVTESLELWEDDQYAIGWVYPSVTPVTAVDANSEIYGISTSRIRITSFPVSPATQWPTGPRFATVTYTGGYDSTTCPPIIKRTIAKLAQALCAPTASGLPANATAARVGDVSVTLASPGDGIDSIIPGISSVLAPYKKRLSRTAHRAYLS